VEARTSLKGASISRTFVAAILVIVAMGLAAMGGYLARTVVGSGSTVTQGHGVVQPAPGTVLRQDNPSRGAVQLPGSAQRGPKASPRTVVDNPGFISQSYAAPAQAERSTGHKELP
jgi:hypothetical protein